MVSIRLTLTLTLVSFLCAAPAKDITVKAKEVVSQDGRDNNIVIKKNVLDVKEDDKNIIEEEEEPIFRHGIARSELGEELLDAEIHNVIENDLAHEVDDVIIADDEEIIENTTVIEKTEVIEEVKEEPKEEPHNGPFFKIPFDFNI